MPDIKIEKIAGKEIKDSRGNPTLCVSIEAGGFSGDFSVPAGASTGTHEAYVISDIQKAIENIDKVVAPMLLGSLLSQQRVADSLMIFGDSTVNKSAIGGNVMLGVSMALARAGAKAENLELYEYLRTLSNIPSYHKTPYLFMNLINGGLHAKNDLAFQEYLVVPTVDDPVKALEIGENIFAKLKEILGKEFGEDALVLGDEGGYAPKISDVRKPLMYLKEAIAILNYEKDVRLSLDVAGSSFYKDGKYLVDGKYLEKEELMKLLCDLVQEFNILSIEDPFQEGDVSGYKELREKNPGLFVVGDDLTVTNKKILSEVIKEGAINAMIIKPNQVGTLSETLETMRYAKQNGIELIVSHRSGETMDDFIADLAYAFGTFGLKAGSPAKAERMVKYQRLIHISKK